MDRHPRSAVIQNHYFLNLPSLVVHADWSINPKKRWMACASFLDDHYLAYATEQVGDVANFMSRLGNKTGPGGCTIIGFDFPIGIPINYAKKVGIKDFITALPKFGQDKWALFYHVAESPDQISLHRPFYPNRPGGTRQIHILDKLGFTSIDDLRRICEKVPPLKRTAAPLFWTLGAQQVGKAALQGWREVIVPGLQHPTLDLVIWPFSGPLPDLIKPGRVIITETYPAEFHHQLRLIKPKARFSKRKQAARIELAERLVDSARASGIHLHHELEAELKDGFGPSKAGEDPFDAVVGLIGMLNVLTGNLQFSEPQNEETRLIEGWMFGLAS
jgi:hypothetical protein